METDHITKRGMGVLSLSALPNPLQQNGEGALRSRMEDSSGEQRNKFKWTATTYGHTKIEQNAPTRGKKCKKCCPALFLVWNQEKQAGQVPSKPKQKKQNPLNGHTEIRGRLGGKQDVPSRKPKIQINEGPQTSMGLLFKKKSVAQTIRGRGSSFKGGVRARDHRSGVVAGGRAKTINFGNRQTVETKSGTSV